MGDIFAILVNPRDGRLYSGVGSVDDGGVFVCDLAGNRFGGGYLDTAVDSEYVASAEATGFPRAHTSDGVTATGAGLGTVLYTSLCARAHLGAVDVLALPDVMPGYRGDGISSETESRTPQADKWWQRARDRFGLAYAVKGCAHREFHGVQSVPSTAARAALAATFGVSPTDVRVDEFDFSARGSYDDCSVEFDAYPYASAREAHLVVALVQSEYEEPKVTGIDPASLIEVDVRALAAANVAALRKPTLAAPMHPRTSARIFGWLLQVAELGGMPRGELDRMRLRYITGVDEDPRTWSEILDPSGYLVARENPSPPWLLRGRQPSWVYATGRQRVTPRRTVAPRPVRLAPPLRANPGHGGAANGASDGAAARAVEDLHALRASLGWGAFADDADSNPGGAGEAGTNGTHGGARSNPRHPSRRRSHR